MSAELIVGLAEGAVALAVALGALGALRTYRARRLGGRLDEILKGMDPGVVVVFEKGGRVHADFVYEGRRCAVDVVASTGWTTHWALRMTGPASAIFGLLTEGEGSSQRALSTGDGGFDQLFAVNAAAPGALRVLSARVRGALVKLPRAMLEPRLAVEIDGVELGWHGRAAEDALVQGVGLLALVWQEFNALLPLR